MHSRSQKNARATLPGPAASTGYASRAYADSLAEFGELIHLPLSNGYLLKRQIPGTTEYDAMGCYPLFFCEDWSRLNDDLENLPAEIVSVSMVADPFGSYSEAGLKACFDVVNPFKQHFMVELGREAGPVGSKHHRKEARKAFKHLRVVECEDSAGFADSWNKLYETLQKRHRIQGIRGFSRTAFLKQLCMPEVVVLQAFHEDELVGAQLYYQQDNVVHCHLGAVTEAGYKRGAFYAMDGYSFDFFSERARWLDLGGGLGFPVTETDGLSVYKSGWSSETRPVYFCGRITNPARYSALVSACGPENSRYFPAYRSGEFG